MANTSAVTQFLRADPAGFVAALAGIRIELEESDSRKAVLAVVDGRADIGIFAECMPTLGLQTVLYRRDRLVLVVPGRACAGRQFHRRKPVAVNHGHQRPLDRKDPHRRRAMGWVSSASARRPKPVVRISRIRFSSPRESTP